MYKQVLIVLAFSALVQCDFLDVLNDCDGVECVEKRFLRSIDEIDGDENIAVVGDYLVLKKRGNANEARGGEGIFERLYRFFAAREMKLKFPTSIVEAREMIAEARSSKIKKFLIPFIILLVLKKSIEIPIFLAVVSLVAFKGLGLGFVSLILSGATALKSLLEQHHSSKVSYEVVPQLTSSSHWSRSGVDYPNLTSGYHTIPQY